MILSINSKDGGFSWTKKRYLLEAAKRLGLDWVKSYDGGDGEFILNVEPYDFVKGNTWTGIWEIDLLLNRPEYGNGNWGKADDLFWAVNCGRGEKHHLLFQACDPVKHKRFEMIESYDFVSCGTNGGGDREERARLITLLKEHGFSFMDYGTGHDIDTYPHMFSTGKVQFIRSMQTGYGDGEIAQRFFECLAIGPVLTNWVDDLKLTGLTEDIDYMAYRDDQELLDKMKLLIDDEKLRNEMARNGREKALLLHTYEHRLISIINTIKDKHD
jgi:hypothetical protein